LNSTQKIIAIVINTSWNVYNFRLGLLKALQKEGYHIVVVAPKDDYTQKLLDEGFTFKELQLDNDSTNTIRELKLMYQLFQIFKCISPIVVLQYTIKPNIYGTLAASFLSIPTLNNISGLGTVFLSNNFSSLIARGLYWFTQRLAHRVLFQNYEDMRLFVKYFFVRKSKAVRVPGSGVDTEFFAPRDVKVEPVTFLFIGRLLKDKGIEEYIEAIRIVKKRHKDVKFQIVGTLYPKNPTATSKKQLLSWIKDGLIEYLGHTDDIRTVIANASCIVLPSYREGLSRSLLEAASMAKPLITTDAPGCRDVVEDGKTGYICKVKDAKDLSVKIEKMIQLSEKQRENMGKEGRKKVISEFSEKIIIDKYLQIIKRFN